MKLRKPDASLTTAKVADTSKAADTADVAQVGAKAVEDVGDGAKQSAQISDGFKADGKSFSEAPSFTLGGVKIHGLDLASVKHGTIDIEMPLKEGTFYLPKTAPDLEDIKLRVPEDMNVKVSIKLDRPDGIPTITDANVDFSDFLVIANPSQSLEKQFKSGFMNKVADVIADMCIKSLHVAQDTGKVHMGGKIKYFGMGPDNTLDEKVKDKMPELNLTLGAITSEGVIKKPEGADAAAEPAKADVATKAAEQNLAVNDTMSGLMKALGSLTGEAKFSVDVVTDPTVIVVETPDLTAETAKDEVRLQMDGAAQVNPDGTMALTLDSPEFLSAGGANVGVQTGLRASDVLTGALAVDGEVNARLDVKKEGMKATVEPRDGVEVKVGLKPGGSVETSSQVNVKGNEVNLSEGMAAWNLQLQSGGMTIPALDVQTSSSSNIKTTGETGFAVKNGDVYTYGGGAEFALAGDDLQVRLGRNTLKIDGNSELGVYCAGVASQNGEIQNAKGTANVEIAAGDGLKPLTQEVDFEFRNGGLRLDRGESHVPLEKTGILGNPNLEYINRPSAGPIGSAAMMERIEEMTGTPIRENNKVSLISEGDDSMKQRMEMITTAEKGDVLVTQALIFKDDETGTELAKALAGAAKRGADVRVIVDALGNVADLDDLIKGKDIYGIMKKGGVKVELYNSIGSSALQNLIDVTKKSPLLPDITSVEDLIEPTRTLEIMGKMFKAAQGKLGIDPALQKEAEGALQQLHKALGNDGDLQLGAVDADSVVDTKEIHYIVQQLEVLNHRWHEKALVKVKPDGASEAIVGGRNFADEYLKGHDETYKAGDQVRPVWRDTDMKLEGAAAHDALVSFSDNWEFITGERVPEPPAPTGDLADVGKAKVQMLQHRPRVDKDHHMMHTKIELLKSMGAGDEYLVENAYFLLSGAMTHFKDAVIDAAKRGAKISIVTNSAETTDLPQINHAAIFDYRDLLENGDGNIRIFERKVMEAPEGCDTGARTVHSKTEVFLQKDQETGEQFSVAFVSSDNDDNRSASLNSENGAMVWNDEAFANSLRDQIVGSMKPTRVNEILAENIESQPIDKELESFAASTLGALL